ncbi:MAG TPA: FAD-dependent oxidoreductase [Pseudonocardiaceae bacterium]
MGRIFPRLSSPIRVGSLTLRNRMMTTSMSPGAGYVEDNRPTRQFLNYLEERAAGETALILQTVCPFERNREHPGGHPLPAAYDDSCVPGIRPMAEAVHKYGGLLVGQPWFVHDWSPSGNEDEQPWGPSAVLILKGMRPFKPMEREHIEIFKQQFVTCAKVLKAAGFDGVEVMAGVGGILNRFLSRATNDRTDEYGGPLENRVRLTVEVIRGIRAEVGPDFPILIRWSPVEFVASALGEGHTIEDSLKVVPYLEEAGIDLHDLAVGWHESSIPLTTKDVPDGYWAWISERIKAVATKPVVTAYRETDPYVMEKVLEQHKADIIGGMRYSLADPEFPKKVVEDRPLDLCLCICCNRCLDDVVGQGLALTKCGVNARLGEELKLMAAPKSPIRKRVLIAGSGPGGLSAAFTAAERGLDVTLYEAGPRIGGSVKMSSIFSPMHERLLKYYKHKLAQHPEIKVVLRTPVTADLVREAKPDAVILAIGGEPKGIDVTGADGKNVVTSHDFLDMLNGNPPSKPGLVNKVMWNCGSEFLKFYYTPGFARALTKRSPWPLGNPIAIIGGGLPGCELGELTMHSGRQTEIFEEGRKVGWDVGSSDRFHMRSAFKKARNVNTYENTTITEITPRTVKAVQKTADGERAIEVDAKTVVVTLGFQPNTGLLEQLKTLDIPVYPVGDCISPGRIADATKAGYQAACLV